MFEHLHDLDINFHLSSSSGVVSRIIDRGSRSINFALTSIVFNVLPTIFEVSIHLTETAIFTSFFHMLVTTLL